MNEIITSGQQMIPETIEDLTQFVLVGKAKLQAYMLKLQTVNKLSVAQEIRDQTLKEAQEISNAVIAAEHEDFWVRPFICPDCWDRIKHTGPEETVKRLLQD